MILKRGVKLQLLAFLLITVVGVSVVAVRYVGIGRSWLGQEYLAYVDMTDTGGVFTNADVTYRGVSVGRVGPMELTDDGIRVQLKLDSDVRIPRTGLIAVVANRSAVGEQFIDLQPAGRAGPYLNDDGPHTIPRRNTRLPVSTAELLRNVNRLVSSVDPQDLGTIVDELDKAFSGTSADLQALLDDSDRVLRALDESEPAASELLDNSRTVLNTQREQAGNIVTFARNLNVLSESIRRDDPVLRDVLDATPPAARESTRLLDQLAPTLPVLLANLTTTGQIMTARLAGMRSLFILYPIAVAGAFTVTPGDGTQHLGLVLNLDSPAPCTKGYEQVKRRWPQFTAPKDPPLNAGCKEPKSSQKDVRGSRNAPRQDFGPPPRVPPGATDGAGFPAGGAGEPDGGARAERDRRTATPANPLAGAATSPPTGDAASPPQSLYVPFSAKTVELAGYDPATGVVYGPDGARYVMGYSGSQQRVLGDASWKMLLLGPLAK